MKKIPLVLIAGFLGAGKTTFLQELLEVLKRRGVPASVIINDFENAEVDAARLRENAATVVETVSGACVCCSSLEEFIGKLADIQVPEKGVLLVEANGASDYISLIAALTARAETQRFTSPLQITMIDASRWQQRHLYNKLESDQIRTSTHWRLSHTGKVAGQRVQCVREQVRQITPNAVESDVESFAQYLSLLRTFSKMPEPAQSSGLSREFRIGDQQTDSHHHVHHHNDELAFTSMAVPLPDVVTPKDLKRILDGLPESVLRVKGICRLVNYPGVAFSIQHLRPEVETWCQPVGELTIEPTCIIIGVGMPVREIRSRFMSLRSAGQKDELYRDALNALGEDTSEMSKKSSP